MVIHAVSRCCCGADAAAYRHGQKRRSSRRRQFYSASARRRIGAGVSSASKTTHGAATDATGGRIASPSFPPSISHSVQSPQPAPHWQRAPSIRIRHCSQSVSQSLAHRLSAMSRLSTTKINSQLASFFYLPVFCVRFSDKCSTRTLAKTE